MNIQVRRGMFETNSSSVHSLIITYLRDKDEEVWYPEYIT